MLTARLCSLFLISQTLIALAASAGILSTSILAPFGTQTAVKASTSLTVLLLSLGLATGEGRWRRRWAGLSLTVVVVTAFSWGTSVPPLQFADWNSDPRPAPSTMLCLGLLSVALWHRGRQAVCVTTTTAIVIGLSVARLFFWAPAEAPFASVALLTLMWLLTMCYGLAHEMREHG